MATEASLILDVERLLYGSARLERPRLDTVTLADDSTTSMTVANTNLWKAHDRCEVAPVDGSVGEILHVSSETGGTATVIRGVDGSTAAAAASGEVGRKNPTYDRVSIKSEIENVVNQELYPWIWYRSVRSLTFTDGDYFYDLAAADKKVLYCYQSIDGHLKELPHGWWDDSKTSIDTTTASTGQLFHLRKVYDSSETVQYVTRSAYTTSDYASLSADVEAAIPYMVAAKLLGEHRLAPSQADPNRQSEPEVQAALPAQTGRQLKGEFLRQRSDINRRLQLEESQLIWPKFQNRRPSNFGFARSSRGY